MNKKYISILLTVLVLIQPFCLTPVMATNQNETGTAYHERAVEIMNALELENYISKDSEKVSRIEFVATLMSLLRSEDIKNSLPSVFEDVKGEHEGALNYAADLKIVSKGTNFRPDDSITYVEALKMCLVATGYEQQYIIKGGWTQGIMRVAYDLKLERQLNLNQTDTLTPEDALTLLYNFMNIKLVNVDAIVQKQYGVELILNAGDNTVLTDYHDVCKVTGIITENSKTSFYTEKNDRDTYIKVDGKKYNCPKYLEDLIGHNVELYVSNTQQTALVGFSERTVVRKLSGNEVSNFKDLCLYCEENINNDKYWLEGNYEVLKNGKAYLGLLSDELLKSCEYINLIDNDRNGEYDIVSLTDASYFSIEKVNYVEKKIYSHNKLDLNIDVSNLSGKYTILNEKGEEITLYNLEPDTVIEAVVSDDKLYAVVRVLGELITGEVNATIYDENLIEINETEYELANCFKTEFPNLLPGTKGNFYRNSNGQLVFCQQGSGSFKYGYIINVGKSRTGRNYEAKMLLQTGKVSIVSFADYVKIDGVKNTKEEAYEDINSYLPTEVDDNSSYRKGQFVKYRLDAEGKLSAIDKPDEYTREEASNEPVDIGSMNDGDKLIRYTPKAVDEANGKNFYNYKASPKILNPAANISTAVIFKVPADASNINDETMYSVATCDIFGNDQNIDKSNVEFYDIDKFGFCSAIVYRYHEKDIKVANSAISAVIEKITIALNEEGSCQKKIQLIVNGTYESYFLGDGIVESSLKSSGENLCKGDIVRYMVENDTIVDLVVDFDASLSVMNKNVKRDEGGNDVALPFDGTGNVDYDYKMGKLYALKDTTALLTEKCKVEDTADDGSKVTIPFNEREYNFNWYSLRQLSVSKSNIVKVVIKYSDTGSSIVENYREVSVTDISEVETYLEVGDYADFAVIRQNGLEGRMLVIYKFVQ